MGGVAGLLVLVGDIKTAGVRARGGGRGGAGTGGGGSGSVPEQRIGTALALRRVCVLISLKEGGCRCGLLIASSVYFPSVQPDIHLYGFLVVGWNVLDAV